MFETAMRGAMERAPFRTLGLAVSGGGDSVALLHLAHDWARGRDIALCVATVDHGLRPEAVDEARQVAQICAGLGLTHETLKWTGWDGAGNLQDAARRARYALMADWAQAGGVDGVALGHTLDDQAETFLLRLARGSGVDGLSAMQQDWTAQNMRWIRPLLDASRADLRGYLTGRGAQWVEDPSNDDLRFDRVKARRALAELAPLGIDARHLSDSAKRLRDARRALEMATKTAAQGLCRVQGGDVLIKSALSDLPQDIQARLFSHALMWVATAPYRPRFGALRDVLSAVLAGNTRTLHGCLISLKGGEIRVTREPGALAQVACPADQIWDGRWQIDGPGGDGLCIRALGETGIAECPKWRETGLSRASILSSPAIWRGKTLIAAPLAGKSAGWTAEIAKTPEHFFTSILTH